MTKSEIQAEIEAIQAQVIAWRRHIHAHPEPSFQEFETMEYVARILTEHGVSHQKGVAETGIVAIIRADSHPQDMPCVALRADLDALPIDEQTNHEFKSTRAGYMHACGHDVHTSILLGVALVLQRHRNNLPKPIKLIFQPGEEQSPGGASLMMAAGVLSNPEVESLVALHVYPEFEVGEIGIKSGLYMASSDEIHVQIEGVGGHGALPERCINPIQMGLDWIQSCQALVKERCPQDVPQVLSFGRFEALGSTNVIPSSAQIKGTFRTMNEQWRAQVHQLLAEQATEISARYGAKLDLQIAKGYPFLQNDEVFTAHVKAVLSDTFGPEHIHELGLRMTAEDFAFYSQQKPVCFFRLGVGNQANGIVHAVHHPQFDVDERSLEVGMLAMASIAFQV
ncbi:MAG: hypothetical protein RLZZ301_899 [Bacteroidota bacterium]|jgi:amidohydrolase